MGGRKLLIFHFSEETVPIEEVVSNLEETGSFFEEPEGIRSVVAKGSKDLGSLAENHDKTLKKRWNFLYRGRRCAPRINPPRSAGPQYSPFGGGDFEGLHLFSLEEFHRQRSGEDAIFSKRGVWIESCLLG